MFYSGQVNVDTTNNLGIPKLTQFVCVWKDSLYLGSPDSTVSVASKTGHCLEGLFYQGSLYGSSPVHVYALNFIMQSKKD